MDDVEVCRLIKEATGPDFHLMFDRTAQAPVTASGQQVWDFETGLKVARGLQKAGGYWLEEPFHRDDYESPARLASMVDILITGGEGYSTLENYKQCLLHRTYDILQPDGRNCGRHFPRPADSDSCRSVPCSRHSAWQYFAASRWMAAGHAGDRSAVAGDGASDSAFLPDEQTSPATESSEEQQHVPHRSTATLWRLPTPASDWMSMKMPSSATEFVTSVGRQN